MKKKLLFIILLFTICGVSLYADDLKITNNKWRKAADFCEIKKVNIYRNSTGNKIELFFIKFKQEKINVKILRARSYAQKFQAIDFLARKSGAVCAINGGFFDENYTPIGVLISGGKIFQKIPTVGNSSIFCVKNNKLSIIHMKDFDYKGVTEALQSAPRLIYDGKDTNGVYGADDVSRRSGVGLDFDDNLIIYATDTIFDGLSFNELRNIFRIKDINLKTALNLDGGRSTQLYFNLNGHKISIAGYDYIPVGIGVFKK